jgi:uncharacterized protein (TIGR03492 family)
VSANSLRPGAPILLLSNGHGEDLSGALIATELRARGYRAEALPLVGHGRAYDQAAIPLLGRTREYSTGGLGYTSLWGRLTEVVQGQVGYLLRRLALLFRIAHRYDLVVVVGDVLPVAAAWLSWRPVVTYLVAYSSHYEGRLSLPWPSGACLASARFRRAAAAPAQRASHPRRGSTVAHSSGRTAPGRHLDRSRCHKGRGCLALQRVGAPKGGQGCRA